MGYYYPTPDLGSLVPDLAGANFGIIYGVFLLLDKSASEVNTLVAPLEEKFSNAKHEWGDKVVIGGRTVQYPDVNDWWLNNITPQTVGFDGRLGSRLLSNDSLLEDPTKLNAALRKAIPVTTAQLIGHLVAGPGVRDAKPSWGNAVNPAWRKAYVHAGMYI